MKNLNLFLLPGLLNDARLWQRSMSDVSDMGHCSVADLTGADSMSALASAALSQAPGKQFALAGFSMGGYVALEIMRQAPERVLGLALLDTSARPDTPQVTEGRRNLMRLAATNLPAVIDALLPRVLHPSHLDDKSILEVIKSMATTVGKEAFLRQQEAIIGREDSRPFLHRVSCPTLVLCGREDLITPVEVHEEMAAAIPNSNLAVVEESGHMSLLEQPQRVTEALRKWLLSLAP